MESRDKKRLREESEPVDDDEPGNYWIVINIVNLSLCFSWYLVRAY